MTAVAITVADKVGHNTFVLSSRRLSAPAGWPTNQDPTPTPVMSAAINIDETQATPRDGGAATNVFFYTR